MRLDHFRGIRQLLGGARPSATTAVGRPVGRRAGTELFEALRRSLGGLPLIAEDLGTITDDVRDAPRARPAFPGCACSSSPSPRTTARTRRTGTRRTRSSTPGTHDNDTARGWFASLGAEDKRRALDYLGGDGSEISWDLMRAALESVAERAIVPVQDVFGLGSEARMNLPGEGAGNWTWKARSEDFTAERAKRFRRLVELTGRSG